MFQKYYMGYWVSILSIDVLALFKTILNSFCTVGACQYSLETGINVV